MKKTGKKKIILLLVGILCAGCLVAAMTAQDYAGRSRLFDFAGNCTGRYLPAGGDTSAIHLGFTWEWENAPLFLQGEDHVVFRWRGRNTEGADRSLELKEATVLLAYGKPFSSEVQYVTEEAWPVDSALNGLDIKVPLEGKDGYRAVRGVIFYTLVPTGQWDIGAAALETGYYCCKEEGDYSMQIGEDGSVIYRRVYR